MNHRKEVNQMEVVVICDGKKIQREKEIKLKTKEKKYDSDNYMGKGEKKDCKMAKRMDKVFLDSEIKTRPLIEYFLEKDRIKI